MLSLELSNKLVRVCCFSPLFVNCLSRFDRTQDSTVVCVFEKTSTGADGVAIKQTSVSIKTPAF